MIEFTIMVFLAYRSRTPKSRPGLGAELHFESSLVNKNLSLCTVTFGEKVLSFHKSRGYGNCEFYHSKIEK